MRFQILFCTEATKLPPSTYSQTKWKLNSTILKMQLEWRCVCALGCFSKFNTELLSWVVDCKVSKLERNLDTVTKFWLKRQEDSMKLQKNRCFLNIEYILYKLCKSYTPFKQFKPLTQIPSFQSCYQSFKLLKPFQSLQKYVKKIAQVCKFA